MNLLRVGRLRPVFKPKRYTTVVAILIVAAGVASTLFAAITSDIQQREYLVGRAQTISDTLPIDDIVRLKGNQDDLRSSDYNAIKQRLQQVSNSNTDIARIHLFVIRDNKVQVAADSKIPDASGYVSPGSNFTEATETLRETFKTNAPRHDNFTRDYAGQWVAAYTPVYDVQTNKTIAVVGIYKDARSFYLEIAAYALVPLLLAAIPLAGILRDIKLEAKEHEILQLKSQFVSIASHELRSPLAGMLWGIQILQQNESKLSLKQRGLLHDMYLSAESSLSTVNEILDLSIFERNEKHTLQRESVDLRTVINQVIATLKLGAQEKNIEILQNGHWPEHLAVTGDVGALKRGFMNIVANAIKYTRDHDTVSITYRRTSDHEHIISVEDHGIGIPADEQTKVLEGYYRATNASEVQAHGTGLGLWLTRKIVQEHGGRLWLNSKVGKGTTVYVALPDVGSTTRQQPAKSAQSKQSGQDS